MGKPPHFQPQGKLSQPQAQGQTRIQTPLHSAIQPRVAAPPQASKPVVPPPPVHWPQPAPYVLQRKVAGGGQQNGADASPAAPPVYWPQRTPEALQTKRASAQSPQAGQVPRPDAAPPAHGVRPAVAQLASLCNCTKPGNKHRSDCPANPKRKKAKAKEVKAVHQESQSIRNIYAYDSAWAKKRGITEAMIKEFGGKIHGHASSRSDTDAKRHANTTKDIAAFHSWFNQKYGEKKF